MIVRTCRRAVFGVAFGLLNTTALAAGSYKGTWVCCMPGVAGPAKYALLNVDLRGQSYTGSLEWGSNYAASLHGNVVRGQLQLSGCTTFRGEVTGACSEAAPPVLAVVSQKMRRSSNASDKSLKSGEWIKSMPNAWQSIAEKCVAVRQ